MSNKKENKDVFLQSLNKVTPLKKSDRNFKKIKSLEVENFKKNKIKSRDKIKLLDNDNKLNVKKQALTIENSPLDKRLKKGKIPIDKKVDFHGLSLEQAKTKFFETIESCFYSNKRCILFVTGKGNKKHDFENTTHKLFYGKIRANFLNWANQKTAISKILNISPAGLKHGGDGAFFVYLRKKNIKFF